MVLRCCRAFDEACTLAPAISRKQRDRSDNHHSALMTGSGLKGYLIEKEAAMSMLRTRTFVVVVSLSLVFSLTSFGQSSGPLDERSLGLAQRQNILSNYPAIEGTWANEVGVKIFNSLLSTSIVRPGRSLEYQLTIIDDPDINAFTTGYGEVYITKGIIRKVLGKEPGLWAVVLGHEIGHSMMGHVYKAYQREYDFQLQRASLQLLAQQGNQIAQWTLLGMDTAGRLAKLKVSRDEENEADHLGLLMMAEAGIHPDFAIATCRRMRNELGDQGKVAAFFGSDHPRWATREENVWRNYDQAMSVFQAKWNDPSRSPGGAPPAVGRVGTVKATKVENTKSIVISLPYILRNAGEAYIEIIFEHKNAKVPGAMPEFQFKDGTLRVVRPARVSAGNEASEFTVSVPATAPGTKERKLDAWVGISAGGKWIAFSQAFRVSFPKP
jgi:hypothetical protein